MRWNRFGLVALLGAATLVSRPLKAASSALLQEEPCAMLVCPSKEFAMTRRRLGLAVLAAVVGAIAGLARHVAATAADTSRTVYLSATDSKGRWRRCAGPTGRVT